MYIVFYVAKSLQARKNRRPLPRGLKFSGWVEGDIPHPVFKYSYVKYVILFSLGDPVPVPPIFM